MDRWFDLTRSIRCRWPCAIPLKIKKGLVASPPALLECSCPSEMSRLPAENSEHPSLLAEVGVRQPETRPDRPSRWPWPHEWPQTRLVEEPLNWAKTKWQNCEQINDHCFKLLNKHCLEWYETIVDNREIVTGSEVQCQTIRMWHRVWDQAGRVWESNEEAVSKTLSGRQTDSRGWRISEEALIWGWKKGKVCSVVMGHGGNVTCGNLENKKC